MKWMNDSFCQNCNRNITVNRTNLLNRGITVFPYWIKLSYTPHARNTCWRFYMWIYRRLPMLQHRPLKSPIRQQYTTSILVSPLQLLRRHATAATSWQLCVLLKAVSGWKGRTESLSNYKSRFLAFFSALDLIF